MSDAVGLTNHQRADVLATLDKILDGGAFGEQSRLRALLCYLVTEELEARGGRIKAYTIGTDVFGRSKDFDPSSDSIVRVEVNRLRQSLRHFYATEGANAPVRIAIPKGTYRPKFDLQPKVIDQADTPPNSFGSNRRLGSLPVLAGVGCVAAVLIAGAFWLYLNVFTASNVDPTSIRLTVDRVDDLNGDGPEAAISEGVVRDLRSALSRNPVFKILKDDRDAGVQMSDFRIESSVQTIGETSDLSIEVINGHSNALVWSRAYTLAMDDNDQRKTVIERVSRELRTRLLGATKEVLEGRDPETLSAHQLFVMATWVSGPAVSALDWEKERLALARMAAAKDPTFGPAYSVLSDKLAFLAGVDGTMNSDAALRESEQSWQRAMELAPLDANAVFNVALGQWHSGQIEASARTMERVVQLDPTHALASFNAMAYPYTCMVAPDAVMEDVLAFDRQLASDDPIRWITLTWASLLHMARGEYELALEAEVRAAQIFQSPYTTMRHAALLNIKNRPDEAHKLIESQRRNWPNIDPAHFAEVTMPRHCQGSPDRDRVIQPYRDLAEAMKAFTD